MGFLDRLGRYLLLLGLPGLALLSFLDSAAVPMVGGPDAVVLLLAWRHPEQGIWIAMVAALGSTIGCLVLYRISRAGGELALSRFKQEKIQRVKVRLEKHAVYYTALSVLAPPPFPTKIVVVAAGVFRIRIGHFFIGVLTGRLVRYGVVAFMAARFGDDAAGLLRPHYPLALTVIFGLVLAMFLIGRMRRRRGAAVPHGKR